MSKTQNDNAFDEIKKLLNRLVHIAENKSTTNGNGNGNAGTDGVKIVEDGVPATIAKDRFFQMIFDDVTSLKKESSEMTEEVLKQGKALKSIEADIKTIASRMEDLNSIKNINTRLAALEVSVDDIKKNMPASFKKWIDSKAKIAGSIVTIAKFIFWTIVILFLVSRAFPDIMTFFTKVTQN